MSFREGQGQTKKHRRFLERSNEVMEFSINITRSKGQKVKVKPVSREMCPAACPYLVLFCMLYVRTSLNQFNASRVVENLQVGSV